MLSNVEFLHEVLDGVKEVESVNPLGAHIQFFDTWKEDVEVLFEPIDLGVKGGSALDLAFSVRSAFHQAMAGGTRATTEEVEATDWEWLLTTAQVAQRTPEWFAEGKRVLTASEIAAIWKGPGTRAALVMSKVKEPEAMLGPPRLAVRKGETRAMDWGVRYEPVVKQILEDSLKGRIQDLGRIRHRTVANLAASPDGLIVEGPPELLGRLVEIKCPPTRVIKDDAIPFEYWCQMQLQMEVCDRPACEFVEAKFKEPEGDDDRLVAAAAPLAAAPPAVASGWISLVCHQDTLELQYIYHYTKESLEQEIQTPWVLMERYPWSLVHLRRVTVLRDPSWFAKIQPDLEAFWRDVEGARQGTWQRPPVRTRKSKKAEVDPATAAANAEMCAIVDSEPEETQTPEAHADGSGSVNEPSEPQQPTSYTDPETT
jgi:putative phage-type endonuclease